MYPANITIALKQSVMNRSLHCLPRVARPKAKKKSRVHLYARQGHHLRSFRCQRGRLTGFGSALDDFAGLSSSHVLEMTESLFSASGACFARSAGAVSVGVDESEVPSNVWKNRRGLPARALEDAVELDA
jgi:hypothetical protein